MNRTAVALALLASTAAQAMDVSAEQREMIGAKIVEYGYQCPAVAEVTPQGDDAYGAVARIWCGQRDRDGRAIQFRMTIRAPSQAPRVLVSQWWGR